VLVLQVAVGLLAAGYGVMFTMLDDWRDQFGIQETGLGFIVAVGFFTSFIAQLTLAPLADKGHARKMLTLGFALNVVGALIMAFGSSLFVFILGRTLMGVGTGIAIPATRRIIIVSDHDNVGRNLGRGVSIEVGGFALGPMISALTVGAFGLAAPFLIMAGLITIAAIVISRADVPETPPEDRTTERFAFDLLRIRPMVGAIFVGLALYVMIGVFDPLWVVMMDDMGAPSWVANAGVSLFGLPWIFFGTMGGKIAERHGPFRVSAFGLLAGAVYMLIYGTLASPYLLLGFALTHAALDAFTVTGTGIAVSQSVPEERQAGASGLLGGLQTLMGGIAAMFAGVIYEHLGRRSAFNITSVTVTALVVAGISIAGFNVLRHPSTRNRESATQ
jgi:MFS family permease